ncbi:MAG: 3-dehydroquinate synthase [Leptospiraceae bacterium]|nr:3-dehydroquinate synthase [Leptospiraceae bacterium]
MKLGNEQIKGIGFEYNITLFQDFDGLSNEILQLSNLTNIVVVTDKNVAKLYLDEINKELKKLNLPVYHIILKPSEKNKSIDRVKKVYNKLASLGCDRKSLILAFGGGVVGDFAGFIAATFLRGIRFAQIPTTLLACVDSSVGGKVAVNIDKGKNMVGLFYQPVFVFAPIHTLSTLPLREWRCGVAEVIKHALLSGNKKLVEALNTTKTFKNFYLSEEVKAFILESVRFKASIVAEDEKELGKRAILNLGHTIGHAIESFTKYKKYSHGEAVSIGLVTELVISQEVQNLPSVVTQETVGTLKKLGMPYKENFSMEDLIKHTKYDKKNEQGNVKFVLLQKIGEPLWGIQVEESVLKKSWDMQRKL